MLCCFMSVFLLFLLCDGLSVADAWERIDGDGLSVTFFPLWIDVSDSEVMGFAEVRNSSVVLYLPLTNRIRVI